MQVSSVRHGKGHKAFATNAPRAPIQNRQSIHQELDPRNTTRPLDKPAGRTATGLVGGMIFLPGLPSAMSFGLLADIRIGRHGILDAIDAGISNVRLPLGGILIALYVGWRVERAEALRAADLEGGRTGRTWLWLLRVLVPISVLAIMVQSAGTP